MSGKLSQNIKQAFWQNFTSICHSAVIEGYFLMLQEEIDYRQSEEEDITAILREKMKTLATLKEKQISVNDEHRIYTSDILEGKKKAKKADRIDFKFTKWSSKNEVNYFAEAKNLSENNWTKDSGANVPASYYTKRYISTGINRLLYGKYSSLKGFLIGYIVNGTAKGNVSNINTEIQKQNLQPNIGLIETPFEIIGYPYCYISTNLVDTKTKNLLHIFLEFDEKTSNS